MSLAATIVFYYQPDIVEMSEEAAVEVVEVAEAGGAMTVTMRETLPVLSAASVAE